MKTAKINRLAKKEKNMEEFIARSRAQNERNETAKRQFKVEKEIELRNFASEIALVTKVMTEANENCKQYETDLLEVQKSARQIQTQIEKIEKSLSFS